MLLQFDRGDSLRLAASFARYAVAVAPLVTWSSTARADLLRVDAFGGSQFTSIQAAVMHAHNGDVILVRTGSYGAVLLDNKGVRVMADVDAEVTINGQLTVQNIPSTKSVLIAGITVVGFTHDSVSPPAVLLSNDQGCVRFQSCILRGNVSVSGDCNPVTVGGAGVSIYDSSRVCFAACQLIGGDGHGDAFSACGGVGGDGGTMNASSVALYDCVVRGGKGGSVASQASDLGGRGGDAWLASDGFVFASRTGFIGGDGGSGFSGGSGGDGLVVQSAASAEIVSATFTGGSGAHGDGGPNGSDGTGQVAGGSVHTYESFARVFSAPWLAADTGAMSVTVFGQPGDRAWIATGEPAHHFAAPYAGVRLNKWPVWLPFLPLGTIGSTGSLTVPFALPLAPNSAATTYFLQGLVIDASGHTLLGSAMHTTVLRCATLLPDCNGNASYDGCDILTGSSVDCDANAVPDECEADCNRNGVADACDIANGTSTDLNHDGIPDECAGQFATHYVDASAAPGGDGSLAHPFQTIGEGIAIGLSGDTILVADGAYVGAGNSNLSFGGRDLVVKSANGPANCVIDLQHNSARAFYINSNETAAAAIDGFTIQNGNTVCCYGGGAIDVAGASPTISNCVFTGCTSVYGGGLDLSSSSSEVRNCVFQGNSAQYGGGLYVEDESPHVHHCLMLANHATQLGGGIYARGYGHIAVSHCKFLGNQSAGRGGGATIGFGPGQPPVRFDDCLFAGNSAVDGSAVDCFGGRGDILGVTLAFNQASGTSAIYCTNAGDLRFRNSILWSNTSPDGRSATLLDAASILTVTGSDFQGGQGAVSIGSGTSLVWSADDITLPPLFVDVDGPDNDMSTWLDNDYRLLRGSPCIDAGDNAFVPPDIMDLDADGNITEPVPFDLDGNPRFRDDPATPDTGHGGAPIVDMGAYEKQP
jgi:hypothetical protein